MKQALLLFIIFLLAPVWAQEPAALYPPDPSGQIVDRAQAEIWADKQIIYYAVLYNKGEQGYIDLYKSGPWKKAKTIKVVFQEEAVKIPHPSVLTVTAEGNIVQLYWNSFVGYQEGAVHIGYSYDRTTGKVRMDWSD